MKEYIEREVVIELANSHKNGMIDANDIARIPAADVVEVVHAKWREVYHEGYEMWSYDCPVCNDGFATKERCKSKPNYCQNCGAKMDGGKTDA